MPDDEYGLSDDPKPAPKKRPKQKAVKVPDVPPEVEPAAKPGPSNLVVSIGAALFMVPVLGFAIFMAVRQEKNKDAEKQAFQAEMEQLVRPPQDGAAPAAKPGLFAIVDVEKRELHATHQHLWNDRRARSPAEAAYIVQLQEVRDTVSSYIRGGKGIKVTYHVAVLDKPTWTVLGRKTFVGADPPLVTVGSGDSDVIGTPPATQELNSYLHGLVDPK